MPATETDHTSTGARFGARSQSNMMSTENIPMSTTPASQADCALHRQCGLPALHRDLCILHSDEPTKDHNYFQIALLDHIKCDKPKLLRIHSFGELYLFDHEFDCPVEFGSSRFHDRVGIANCRFKRGCRFSDCDFEKKLSLHEIHGSLTVHSSRCRDVSITNSQLGEVDFGKTKSVRFVLAHTVVAEKACFNELNVSGDLFFTSCSIQP